MPTVYISASSRWTALFFKEFLQRHGVVVTSDWHDRTVGRTSELTAGQKMLIADEAKAKIQDSTHLLLVSDPDMVPGGKFVDVGIAIGSGRKVIVVGRHENIKMYDSQVLVVATPEDALKVIRE